MRYFFLTIALSLTLFGQVKRVDDALLRYRYAPGRVMKSPSPGDAAITITSDGLWDVPHSVEKAEGTVRVVVLGPVRKQLRHVIGTV